MKILTISFISLITIILLSSGCKMEIESDNLYDYIEKEDLEQLANDCNIIKVEDHEDCHNAIMFYLPKFEPTTEEKLQHLTYVLRHMFFMPLIFNENRVLLSGFKDYISKFKVFDGMFYEDTVELQDGYFNKELIKFFMQRVTNIKFQDKHHKSEIAVARYEKEDGTLTIYNNFFNGTLSSNIGILVHEGLHYDFGLHGSCSGRSCDRKMLKSPYAGGALFELLSFESIKFYDPIHMESKHKTAINAAFSVCESLSPVKRLPKVFPQSLEECVGLAIDYSLDFNEDAEERMTEMGLEKNEQELCPDHLENIN